MATFDGQDGAREVFRALLVRTRLYALQQEGRDVVPLDPFGVRLAQSGLDGALHLRASRCLVGGNGHRCSVVVRTGGGQACLYGNVGKVRPWGIALAAAQPLKSATSTGPALQQQCAQGPACSFLISPSRLLLSVTRVCAMKWTAN